MAYAVSLASWITIGIWIDYSVLEITANTEGYCFNMLGMYRRRLYLGMFYGYIFKNRGKDAKTKKL